MQSSSRPSWQKRWWEVVLWWVFCFCVYLLLAGEISPEEIVAGAVATSLAVTASIIVDLKSEQHYAFRFAWLAPISRAVPVALSGCWTMFSEICARAAGRGTSGNIGQLEFDPGTDSPVSRGRKAVVTAAISLAPDSFVLGINNEQGGRILLHRYGPAKPKPADGEWPI